MSFFMVALLFLSKIFFVSITYSAVGGFHTVAVQFVLNMLLNTLLFVCGRPLRLCLQQHCGWATLKSQYAVIL